MFDFRAQIDIATRASQAAALMRRHLQLVRTSIGEVSQALRQGAPEPEGVEAETTEVPADAIQSSPAISGEI